MSCLLHGSTCTEIKPLCVNPPACLQVKSGDIAYDIAASYNITLEDLVAQNAGINANSLMVGQVREGKHGRAWEGGL